MNKTIGFLITLMILLCVCLAGCGLIKSPNEGLRRLIHGMWKAMMAFR